MPTMPGSISPSRVPNFGGAGGTKKQPPGQIRNRGGKQLFTVQEAIQTRGRPHGPHQVVPQDLRWLRQARSDVTMCALCNVLNSCLELNIKNINQFRHVKHAFPCREGMLSGTFARNQFSDRLTAEKIPSHDLAISVREVTRVHSLKSVSRSHTRWGWWIEWGSTLSSEHQ